MTTEGWYYTHDGHRHGPFSGRELRALAASGAILRTDTIGREGVETGVLAETIQHLFPATVVVPVAAEPPAVVADPVRTEVPQPQPVVFTRRKLTAVAGQGAVIMSQDGERVKFKKKCLKCRHEDSTWTTLPISVGVMRAGFFCPKCRQRREVELHGRQV